MSGTDTQVDPKLCAEISAACACLSLRKASRAVTQMFDEILGPSGLRSTQLVVLIAIAQREPAGVSRLAKDLVLDSSTLLRTLATLEAQDLVKKAPGKDRRRITVSLTGRGRRAVLEALPLWRQAQETFVARLGREPWDALRVQLTHSVEAARL